MVDMYQEPRLAKDTRVRLRPHVDPAIYGDFACIGNEGYIREVREDRFGLPEYLIEWDQNHWTWNGIPNGWAFAEHFEPVKENMSDFKIDANALAKGLQALMALGQQGQPQPQQTHSAVDTIRDLFGGGEESSSSKDENAEYTQAAEAASNRLAESDAFILIGMDRHQNPQAVEGILEPYVMVQSKTDEGHVLLSAYLSELGSRAHYKLAMERAAEILQAKDA